MTPRTFEINPVVKVCVVKDLHRNLFLLVIQSSEFTVVNGDVLLDVLSREGDFFVFALAIHAHKCPVRNSYGNSQEHDKERISNKATAVDKRQHALYKPGDGDDEACELEIGELTIALCETNKWSIFNRPCVCNANSGRGHCR